MTSPKGPKVVVRTFAGTGVFTGQYALFPQAGVFRKMRWERPGRRSWRSGQQLNEEADRVPVTEPILLPLAPGNNPFFQAFSRGWKRAWASFKSVMVSRKYRSVVASEPLKGSVLGNWYFILAFTFHLRRCGQGSHLNIRQLALVLEKNWGLDNGHKAVARACFPIGNRQNKKVSLSGWRMPSLVLECPSWMTKFLKHRWRHDDLPV